MENNENTNLIDSTCYDFDLFSMDIYRKLSSIFNIEEKKFYINKLFMVATAGLNFNVDLINFNKNGEFLNALIKSDIEFDVKVTENISEIITNRYGQDEFEFDKESAYLKSFKYFASKGFYAYDKKISINSEEGFELIASPVNNEKNYMKLLKLIFEIYYPDIGVALIEESIKKKNFSNQLVNIEMTKWYKSVFL